MRTLSWEGWKIMDDTIIGKQLLIKSPEAATFLGVGERTLWSLTAPRGPIPSVKIGCSVRFDKRDLIAFVDAQKQKSNQQWRATA
jgi:predicted DNA-binding transcriptional regulator AlpA